ncbi:MerR family transcriptional regulator [Leuconostoc citreum]
MYTISQLAELSRVSSRTLRYYDDISLLKPALINKSGYRIYTQREVDILHRILVYRSMDVPLKEIKRLLESDQDDIVVF